MSETKERSGGEITIYKDNEGPAVEVSFEGETAWLTQAQISSLFQKDQSVISRHIRSIYEEGELKRLETSHKKANVQNMHIGLDKPTTYYNLDVVISVGYRVNSKRGVQFRIWATQRLRDYLLKGFAVNQERLKEQSQAKLKELEGAVRLLQRAMVAHKTIGLEKELLSVITEYAGAWATLVQYDENDFPEGKGKKPIAQLDYESLAEAVEHFSERLDRNSLAARGFGQEQGSKFKQLIDRVNTAEGNVGEIGALLFYSVIAEKPFTQGNKQIASLLLLLYLIHNNSFYNRKGERKLDDSTMVALSVLVEEGSKEDKSIVLQLIASMINKK